MKAIITFHSIDQSGSVLSFAPDLFAELIASLRESGISIVGLHQLLDDNIERAVTITFDDGFKSVYTNALPVLKEFDAPALLFLTTGPIGKPDLWPDDNGIDTNFHMLDWPDIEKLHAAGVSIEGHTKSHLDMRTLSKTQMSDQCESADRCIEERLGRRPEFFAYPFGYHNAAARDYARRHYAASVTTELSILGASCDSAAIPRLDSYYLQPGWLSRNILSPQARMYFRFRSMLRS